MSSADGSLGTIERAFQLARAGTCHSVADIRQRLNAEGYVGADGHLSGMSIQKQLKAAMTARGANASASSDEAEA